MVRIKKIWFSEGKIFAEYIDGRAVGVPISWYPNLSKGSLEQWQDYEIWADGQYVHWPSSAEGLLALSQTGLPQKV